MKDLSFPAIEFFDRLAIAEVKWDRTASNLDELNWYKNQLKNYNMSLMAAAAMPMPTIAPKKRKGSRFK